MSLLDIFQKKERARQAAKERSRKEASSDGTKPSVKEEAPKGASAIRESRLASEVLLSAHITEKAAYLSETLPRKDASGGQYVFKVADKATKPMVKRAVEEAYGVKVEGVKIIPKRNKSVRVRGILGKRKGAKKALVILRKGDKIEFV